MSNETIHIVEVVEKLVVFYVVKKEHKFVRMASMDGDDTLDLFDKLIYGKTKAEMGVFIPGISARRVRKP